MTNDFLKIYENGTHGLNDWKYYGDIIFASYRHLNDPYDADYIHLAIVDPEDTEIALLQDEIIEMAAYARNHEGWSTADVWDYEKNWFLNKIDTGIYRYTENYKMGVAAITTNQQSCDPLIEKPENTAIIPTSEWKLNTVTITRQGGIGGYPNITYSQGYLSNYTYGQINGGVHIFDYDDISGQAQAISDLKDYLFGDQDPEIVDPSIPEQYEDTPITASTEYNNLISNFLTNFTVLAEIDGTNLNLIAQALNTNITLDDSIPEMLAKIARSLVQKNISEGILSIKIIPIPTGGALPYKTGILETLFKPIGVGNVQGKKLNNTLKKYQIGSMTVHKIYDDYRDFLCEYSIYLPFSGIHQLDADVIVGNILNIYCDIDFLTGSILYHLIVNNGSTSRDIYTFTGDCAIELPITGNDYSAKYEAIVNGIFSGVGMIAGATVGGPVGAMAGAGGASALTTGLKTLGNAASVKGNYMQSGKLVPNSCALSVLYPYLIVSTPQDVSPDYRSIKGKPTHKMLKLNTLRGFTIISNINLDGVAYATDEDKEALRSLLANGVFF